MQGKRIGRKLSAEEKTQRAILALVLAVNPHYRTIPEMAREIGSREAVERAVGKLVDYGLLTLHGNTLLPTEAAFRCHRLDAW
jgi:superfamily II helicase